LRTSDAQLLWQTPFPGEWDDNCLDYGMLSADGKTLFASGDICQTLAISTVDGTLLWRSQISGIGIGLTGDGSVMVSDSVLSASDGKVKFKFNASDLDGCGIFSRNPAVSPDKSTVYFNSCEGMFAMSTIDGHQKWVYVHEDIGASGIVLSAGGTLLHYGEGRTLHTLDGTLLWKDVEGDGPEYDGGLALSQDENTLYFGSRVGNAYAMDISGMTYVCVGGGTPSAKCVLGVPGLSLKKCQQACLP
jgi:outer membrane protein assembly factor BamB